MVEIILFTVAIFLYVLVSIFFFVPKLRKILIIDIEKQSSIEIKELKQNTKIIIGGIIFLLIMCSILFVQGYHQIISDTILFVTKMLFGFLMVYFFALYVIFIKYIIKEKERKQQNYNLKQNNQ